MKRIAPDSDSSLKSHEQFNTLMNNVEGIVWEADAQTFKFSFVSKQAEVLLGYPVQQWINEPTFWKDHIHPDDRDWAVSYCVECTQKKEAHKFEYRMIAADGRTIWLQDIVSVIVEDDQPLFLTGLMIDVTERKKAELLIIDSERRYRNLFEQNLAGVYRTSINGMILACNNAFAAMLGYDSSEELLHRHASDLYYAVGDRDQFITRLCEQGKIYNSEFVLKRKNGDPLFILENSSLSNDPVTGEEIIDGILIDISQAKKTSAALQKTYEDVVANETLLKSAEQLAHFGSWSCDLKTGALKWSDEIYRIYGYEPGSIIPTFDFFLTHVFPDDLAYIKQKMSDLFNDPSSQKLYFRIIDSSGNIRCIHSEYQIECDANGKAIKATGFNMDVTEKIQLEEKLVEEKIKKRQEITNAVITAQEQERKRLGEELHDNINQILATARLYVESAIADASPRKDLLLDSKNYIVSAMNEIRDLSRSLLPPSLGVISLTEALKDLLQTINKANQLICITDCEELDESLISDPLKLTIFRIVQEQMNNVITHANAKNVIVQLTGKANQLRLSIHDDGIGFDPSEKRKGVGLQNIGSRSELFGGNVVINSAPGVGCEVVVEFALN